MSAAILQSHTVLLVVTFVRDGTNIQISSLKVRSTSALTDGKHDFFHQLSSKNNDTLEFEESVSYFLKNLISKRYEGQNVYFGRSSSKFRAAALAFTEDEEKAAKQALCPPSHPDRGEEDIFSRGDYWTLQGQVEKVSYFNAITGCLHEDENEESNLFTKV